VTAASAHGAIAQPPILGSAWTADPSAYRETALPRAARLRAALLGLALGGLSVIATVAIALAIVTGPFHTSLGSLA
jgi:hypothetical protein